MPADTELLLPIALTFGLEDDPPAAVARAIGLVEEVLGKLADLECRHGRLPLDRTPAWRASEGAMVIMLAALRSAGGSNREAA